MIRQETIDFLSGLKNNNTKEWFHDHKKAYQEALDNFLEVTNQLIIGISSFDEGVSKSKLDFT